MWPGPGNNSDWLWPFEWQVPGKDFDWQWVCGWGRSIEPAEGSRGSEWGSHTQQQAKMRTEGTRGRGRSKKDGAAGRMPGT